ncbi:hypothetical protein [Bradyrhizobium sp.]
MMRALAVFSLSDRLETAASVDVRGTTDESWSRATVTSSANDCLPRQ